MSIRRATPDDLAAVTACARAAYEMYVPRIGKEPAPMVADFSAQIASGKVYVVLVEGSVEGYAVFYPEGDHLHLENIAVFPHNRGRGLGGRLIAFVEDEARRLGLAAVELYTNEKMTENLRMYPKLGYAETGRRREAGFDRVYFRKEI
ncbi:MAG: GNAT family N-acetyltransferase [Alphaproteobacteria bacterium]|nr:GNAT family N-acetyltransferase [Alphaproteobacteria bacterium]